MLQMADDEDLSGRTESTTTNGGGSSRSYTASPTPASRVPPLPLAASSLRHLAEAVIEVPVVASGEAPLSLRKPDAEDHDMESAEVSDRDSDSAASMRSAVSDNTQLDTATDQSPAPVVAKDPTLSKSQSSRRQSVGAPQLDESRTDEDPVDPDAGSEEGSEVEDDDSSEESTDDSEEEESEESEADSSFEAASASSDDEVPVRKQSRRGSNATGATPVKARKSSIAVARPVIPEVLEESEDEVVSKVSRSSTSGIPGAKNAARGDKSSSSSPSTSKSTKTRKPAIPVSGMADLQLDEAAEPTTSDAEVKAEPAKKKKR